MRKMRLLISVLVCGALAACGTYVPELREKPNPSQADTQNMIDAVVQSVRCQLRTAVTKVVDNDVSESKKRLSGKTYSDFLGGWGAEVAFTFTIVEKTIVNPTILGAPPSPASAIFSVTAGLNASSQATRVEKINFFYTVKELYMPRGVSCEESKDRNDSLLVQNDLKISDILYGRIGADVLGQAHSPDAAHKNVLSHEISFQVVTGGNITPMLKLVRASIDPSGTLLSASRDRTHDLVITFGPLDKASGGTSLIQIAEQTHYNQQLANGVTSGFRSAITP